MKKQAGFTLLEMLVVMAIIALLMSLIGPSFMNSLKRSEQRFAIEQIQAQLAQLPRWSRLLDHPFAIKELTTSLLVNNEEVLLLPEGWRIEFTPELVVSPIQICSASTARIVNAESMPLASLSIASPFCATTENAEDSP